MSPHEPSSPSPSPSPVRDQARPFKSSLQVRRLTKGATASQAQAGELRSHLDSHIHESMGHKSSFEDSVTSMVSWSDSDGSTYESEHCQDKNGSLTVRSSSSEDNVVDTFTHNVKSPPTKPLSTEGMPKTTNITGGAATSQEVQLGGSFRPMKSGSPRLEHVEYYSHVDVASTNDGLSSVGFISKEDTRPIFCRRIVPLEVPVPRRPFHDDVSAFSSCDPPSVMPTGDSMSVQVVHSRRATGEPTRETTSSPRNITADRVEYEYLSNIEIASHHHVISTITCRVSRQTAASAFHDINHDDSQLVGLTSEPIDGPLINKHLTCHNRLDSISTLGSASVTSAASDALPSSFDDDDDTGSSTKPTPSKTVKRLSVTKSAETEIASFSHTKKYSKAQGHDLESLQTELRHQNQETTNQRIRNLKEKIKQMQVASTMENLPDTRKILPTLTESSEKTTESSRHSTGQGIGNQHIVASRGQCQSQKVDIRKPQQTSRHHAVSREIDIRKRSQDLSACILRNLTNSESTLSHDKRGEVPSVVTPLAHDADDISTIHCDIGYSGSKDFVDVELEGALGLKNSGPKPGTTISRVTEKSIRAFTSKAKSLTTQANTYLEHCVGYHNVKTWVAGLWMKYVHGRSRTEQAILGVILLSFSILFILVISLISG